MGQGAIIIIVVSHRLLFDLDYEILVQHACNEQHTYCIQSRYDLFHGENSQLSLSLKKVKRETLARTISYIRLQS